MLSNIIKIGGSIMVLYELADQVKKVRRSRDRDKRRSRTKNMVIGGGIGSAVGVVAGILFAPKSGKETRQIIADKTSETVKNFKDNVSATKDKISASAAEKGSRLREAGKKGVEAVKEAMENTEEDKKKKSHK